MNQRIMINEHTTSRKSYAYPVFWVSFIAVTILTFWKCRYGYAHMDEAFYLTIPYRFIQGDRILFDEWNNSQLSAFPLIPVIRGFIGITGGTEGIYLFVRYFYAVLKCILSLLLYASLRKFHVASAMVSSVCFLAFSSYGLMVLSYNSMAIGGLLFALCFLLTDVDSPYSRISFFMSGIALSVAVLSFPYLAILYILYILGVIAVRKSRTGNAMIRGFFSGKAFLWMSAGIFAMVAVFSVYVLSRTSLQEIIQTIPRIFTGDPDHPPKVLWKILPGYLARIVLGNNKNLFTFVMYALFGLELCAILADKKRTEHKTVFLYLSAVLTLCLLLVYFFTDGYINHILFVPNVIAVILFLLSDDERIRGLFVCIWMPGMIYSLLEHIGSNTGFDGISSAASTAAVGSMMIIGIQASLVRKQSRLLSGMLLSVLAVTTAMTLYYKATYIFWENSISEQTEIITDGTQAGLLVTKDRYEYYYGIRRDTEEMRNLSKDTHVLYLGDKSLWLEGDQRCGSYSPLGYGISQSRNNLYAYYEEHPEKKAKVIYVDFLYDEGIAKELSEAFDLQIEKQSYGYLLKKEK